MTDIRIIDCTDPAGLFHHYDKETFPQSAYIELDLRDESLLATYDAEIGGAIPFSVFHGFERRYGIPTLTADAANRVMREIEPLAQRIVDDWEKEWNGNNMVAVLGEDAQAAESEIETHLGSLSEDSSQGFDPDDLVEVWDIDSATYGGEADEYNITADTTDERLDEIEKEILDALAGCGNDATSGIVVCHGLAEYLRDVRQEAIDTAEGDDED